MKKDILRVRVLFHDWKAQAINSEFIAERLEIIMELKKLPMNELTEVLGGLPECIVAVILQLIQDLSI